MSNRKLTISVVVTMLLLTMALASVPNAYGNWVDEVIIVE